MCHHSTEIDDQDKYDKFVDYFVNILVVLFSVLLIASIIPLSFADEYKPPLKQIQSGILPYDVSCNDERVLFLKHDSNKAYCIKPESVDRFSERTWFEPSYDTSKHDTTKMTPSTNNISITSKLQFTPNNTNMLHTEITPSIPQYSLPLNPSQIINWDEFNKEIQLSQENISMLRENGFVVIDNTDYSSEYIQYTYDKLTGTVPIYVTPDALLHLYHVQFSETLKNIEQDYFYDDLWYLSDSLLNISLKQHDTFTDESLKKAAYRNAVFFAVGLHLLEPDAEQTCFKSVCPEGFTKTESRKYSFEVPDNINNILQDEISKIESKSGFSKSPLFSYKLDYSYFEPRGHYTQSEKLKNYFQAMMWYGTPTFLITSPEPEFAKLQTIQAVLLSESMLNDEFLKEKWDRIYTVTSFYVGESDDLGSYEYLQAYDNTISNNGIISLEDNLDDLKIELAKMPQPKINGGTGTCNITGGWSVEKAEKCLEDSQGFRFMGSRFIPDSYIFSNLVGMEYTGNDEPFTMVSTSGGQIRGFPTSLDLFSVMGSDRAYDIMHKQGDTQYAKYETQINSLKAKFNSFSEAHWKQNLYWNWLYSLESLLAEYGNGYPTFMQTESWQDKNLNTVSASWSELRHDTILYAKQSFTGGVTGLPYVPPITGYVEPVPEFYQRMYELTIQTRNGLDNFGLLGINDMRNYDSLEYALIQLHQISLKELNNEYLSDDDYSFIDGFAKRLLNILGSINVESTKTTLVTDVHTESNTSQILEVGTGYTKLLIVAYKLPENQIVLGAGPVLTYYEFKHPQNDRLNDEKWKETLTSDDAPLQPYWTTSYVGEK